MFCSVLFVCLSLRLGFGFIFKHLLPENPARVIRDSQCPRRISFGVSSFDVASSSRCDRLAEGLRPSFTDEETHAQSLTI